MPSGFVDQQGVTEAVSHVEEQWVLWEHTEGIPDVNMGCRQGPQETAANFCTPGQLSSGGRVSLAEGRACGKAKREKRLNSTVRQACGKDEAQEGPLGRSPELSVGVWTLSLEQ